MRPLGIEKIGSSRIRCSVLAVLFPAGRGQVSDLWDWGSDMKVWNMEHGLLWRRKRKEEEWRGEEGEEGDEEEPSTM